MTYIRRFSLFSYKCFSGNITYCQSKAFDEGKYEKINGLPNFKCNHASHNKIRDTAIELSSRGSFQDLELRPKEQ